MKSQIAYIKFEDLLTVYDDTIAASGGGLTGIRDENGIRSILEFVQNDDYYPSLIDKLTFIVYNLCRGHYFNDCNKRMALTVGSYFLFINGHFWHACHFLSQMEAFVYHIAAGTFDRDILKQVISCFLHNTDYDESLKIKISQIMSNSIRFE